MRSRCGKVFLCMVLLVVLLTSCSSGGVKVKSVEQVDSIGYEGMGQASAKPGYVLMLLDIRSKEDFSSNWAALVLRDGAGTQYSCAGLFDSKYIFEVKKNTKYLILVVNVTEEVPLP